MADMDAKLEAALDLFGSATTATLVTYQRAGKTLAAAVRAECRRADSNLTWVHQQQDRARKAEAALAELRGRVCETCRRAGKCRVEDHLRYWSDCTNYVTTLTCGAWAAKE